MIGLGRVHKAPLLLLVAKNRWLLERKEEERKEKNQHATERRGLSVKQ